MDTASIAKGQMWLLRNTIAAKRASLMVILLAPINHETPKMSIPALKKKPRGYLGSELMGSS
jgi:hypothetical protein